MDILDQTNEFEGCGQNIPKNQPKLKQVTTSGTKKKSSLSTKSEKILPLTVYIVNSIPWEYVDILLI